MTSHAEMQLLEAFGGVGIIGGRMCGVLDIFEHAKLDRNGKLISQHNYIAVQ